MDLHPPHETITAVRLIGQSMTPTFLLGSRVAIEPCARPHVGQVALIAAGPHLILHRLVGRFSIADRTWYLHAGDHQPVPGLARGEEILGVAPEAPTVPIGSGVRLASLALNILGPLVYMGRDLRSNLLGRWFKNVLRFISRF